MGSLPEECASCSGNSMALLVLPGVEYEVMRNVLRFLYTGVIRVFENQIPQVSLNISVARVAKWPMETLQIRDYMYSSWLVYPYSLQVRKLLERILRVDAKIELPDVFDPEEEAEMAAAAAAALTIKSEPRDFDDDHDGAGASGTGGGSPPASGSGTGGSSSDANGTSNGGDAMDMPGPSTERPLSDHECSGEIHADFIPPSPPDSNQGDDNEEDTSPTSDLNKNSCNITKEANSDEAVEELDEDTIDVVSVEENDDGNLSGPERNVDTEPAEANTNADTITVRDDDEDDNSSGGENSFFGDSGRSEPQFLPAPGVIAKKTSRSNKAFFATKSTSSSGSGGCPRKVIAKRPGGHLRDRGASAKKAKGAPAREVDYDITLDDSHSSSSDSDSSPAPSPDTTVGEDPDFNLGQDNGVPILLDLPNPLPQPPQAGLIIHRGEWVTPAKRNRLLAKRDKPRSDIRKYNYKPFESTITGQFSYSQFIKLHLNDHNNNNCTITGYSKLSTVAAAEEEEDGEWPCSECGAKFTRERSLNSHVSRAHNPNARWPCPENCGKMLSSQTAIKKHLLSHRPEAEWPYQCR